MEIFFFLAPGGLPFLGQNIRIFWPKSSCEAPGSYSIKDENGRNFYFYPLTGIAMLRILQCEFFDLALRKKLPPGEQTAKHFNES